MIECYTENLYREMMFSYFYFFLLLMKILTVGLKCRHKHS